MILSVRRNFFEITTFPNNGLGFEERVIANADARHSANGENALAGVQGDRNQSAANSFSTNALQCLAAPEKRKGPGRPTNSRDKAPYEGLSISKSKWVGGVVCILPLRITIAILIRISLKNGVLHLMEVSVADSATSGATMGAARDEFDGMNLPPSPPSRLISTSSAWSTTDLPAEGGDANEEGEVVQEQESETQELGCVVEQVSWEEGFGDFDPAADPGSPRSTGSSTADNESGVFFLQRAHDHQVKGYVNVRRAGVASEDSEMPPYAKRKRKRVLANDCSGGGPSMRRSRRTLVLVPEYLAVAGQVVPAQPPSLLAESAVLRGRVVKCTWSCHQILHLGLRSYGLVDRTGMASLLTAAWTGEADRRFYAWLLSRFSWEDMRFTFPDGEYRYFSPRSIVRTLGLKNSGRQEMFACVLCNGGTGEYDLAEWAFEIIRAAVKKLQKDLEAGVRTLIVGGSHLALIPWFLDWIDFGANNVEPHTVPRISVYTGQICRRLIYLIREYPNIFTTKPYDAFNPLDDVWHGVVGEYGGFLQQPALELIAASQQDAMVSVQEQRGQEPDYDSGKITAIQEHSMLSEQRQGGQGPACDYGRNGNDKKLSAAKGKWAADDSSDSSSSDSDDEPVDPSVRLARRLEEADRRGLHCIVYQNVLPT
ncbi:hypothetical protein TRIUR3_01870 [Triticum urartu]|uniref:Uncharacterized protein n=1 Tax=Triticum urartu TaxID=4572 RepID=M7ZPC3_TRIUA|nr:hypothetical protein TRIUR3_01870 [Triticum urartu]